MRLTLTKSGRSADRAADARSTALIRRAAAVCLTYPDAASIERLALVRDAAAAGDLPSQFADFAAYATTRDAYDLATAYVATFDQRNRNSLYLTWWTAGDTRNRGNELVRFIQAYRACGYEYTGEELPDHLPTILEFASSGAPEAVRTGTKLLTEHHVALTKLHEALSRGTTPSPYAPILAAVLATVPAPSPDDVRDTALAASRFTPIPLAFGDSR